MKKLFVLGLTIVLVLAVSIVAGAATKTTIGGEGNFGYKLVDGENNDSDFSSYKLVVTAEVNPNVTLLSKIKCDPAANDGTSKYFTDECTATIKMVPATLTVGFFGFGFGGNKDLLDAACKDFKSEAALQMEIPLGKGLTGKVLYIGHDSTYDANAQAGAYGLRADYSLNKFGAGFIYGDLNDNQYDKSTAYTVTASYKVMPDLMAYIDYSTLEENEKNTNIILGAYYTSDKSPWEFRAEYDLNNENKIDNWSENFNPWQVRLIYKFSPNLKVQFDGYQKSAGDNTQTAEAKVVVSF
jgi:hypothetical protein